MTPREINVWDRFVRSFHWLLVASVTTAAVTGFVTGAETIDIHIWAGVTAVVLVVLRLVWGFLGTEHARFSDFVRGPRAALVHLRGGHRSLGHNPLGGWMVLTVILVLFALGATGALVLGGVFHTGPAGASLSVADGFRMIGLHKALAVGLLILIALHLGGVAFESRRGHENLVRAMVTGRKPAHPGDRAPRPVHPRVGAAVVIGLAVLATGGALATGMSMRPVAQAPVNIADSAYVAQCSDCHMAYHPSLLPAKSWHEIMSTLSDHFGEDASVSAADRQKIEAYLVAHSAETTDTKPALLFRDNTALSVNDSRAWQRIHRNIPKATFAAAPVYSKTNCAACHSDAASGWFYPGNIEIPEN